MLPIILVGLAAWAVLATVVCVAVCMAAARFNREAEQNGSPLDSNLSVARGRSKPQGGLAPQQSRS
jgi:hypothetical protein